MLIAQKLLENVSTARTLFLDEIKNVSEVQAKWKPAPDAWCITEITEHLFWAEQGAILSMWKTMDAIRAGEMEARYDSIHQNMPIEEIINLTWQLKEIVPPVAAPHMSGPLAFWIASLEGLQLILTAFAQSLKEEEWRMQAHPHPISGAMDFQQRLEFLSFHIHRHRGQVVELLGKMK